MPDEATPTTDRQRRQRVRVRKAAKGRQQNLLIRPQITQLPPNAYPDIRISMQHERLVGRLVMRWATIEGIIQSFIWELLSISFADGKAITSRNDVQANMMILRNVAPRRLTAEKSAALL